MEKWITTKDLQHDFPVEKTFDEFVSLNNGTVIRDTISKNPDFLNCDYKFEFEECNYLIELKALENDFASDEDKHTKERIAKLFNQWVIKGEISFAAIFNSSLLNPQQKLKYLEVKYVPLHRVLKKANRQLRETKNYYQFSPNHGIVVLVDDGLDSVEIQDIYQIVSHYLVRDFSEIHAFVLMTMNRYIHVPNDEYARQVWLTAYGVEDDKLHKFVNHLGNQWGEFFGEKIGGWDTPKKDVDSIREMGKELRKIKG